MASRRRREVINWRLYNMPKKPATKAKPKPKMKIAAKTSPVKKAAKSPAKKPVKSPRGFMWKLLEQKQAEQKKRTVLPAGYMPEEVANKVHHEQPGFSRFNGPRRKAG